MTRRNKRFEGKEVILKRLLEQKRIDIVSDENSKNLKDAEFFKNRQEIEKRQYEVSERIELNYVIAMEIRE